MEKKKVGLIFGGKSAEHEVSLQSAKNVLEAIDQDKYEVTLIGIDKEGRWHLNNASQFLLNADDAKLIELNKTNHGIAVVPGESENQLMSLNTTKSLSQLDVVFLILHGTLGRMEAFRECSGWRTSLLSAPIFLALQFVWIRT